MEVSNVSDARELSPVTQPAPGPAPETSGDRREDIGSDVTRDQVNLLFQHANVTLIAGGLLIVLASSALSAWGQVDPTAMLRWMAITAAALLLRGFCVWRYFDTHGQRRPLYLGQSVRRLRRGDGPRLVLPHQRRGYLRRRDPRPRNPGGPRCGVLGAGLFGFLLADDGGVPDRASGPARRLVLCRRHPGRDRARPCDRRLRPLHRASRHRHPQAVPPARPVPLSEYRPRRNA